jgi:hypothetical protein
MNTVRLCRLYLVGFVMLLTFASNSFAFAAPPEFQTVPLDVTFIDQNATNQCGFPVQVNISGTLKISIHDLPNGTAVEIDRYFHATTTFTNLNTDVSYTSKNAGPTRLVLEPDGTSRLAVTGIAAIIILPKEGLVLKNVGRLIIDENGNIIFQAGTAPLYTGGDVSGVCTALSESEFQNDLRLG